VTKSLYITFLMYLFDRCKCTINRDRFYTEPQNCRNGWVLDRTDPLFPGSFEHYWTPVALHPCNSYAGSQPFPGIIVNICISHGAEITTLECALRIIRNTSLCGDLETSC